MLIMENIRLALMSLKANKMRALLTMLGIIIGISSVIGIMTVGNSLTETVNSNLAGMGVSNISIGIERRDANYNDDDYVYIEPKDSDYFSSEMILAYRDAFPDVIKGLSFSLGVGNGQATYKLKSSSISVKGCSRDNLTSNRKTYLAGDLFSETAMKNGSQVVIISDQTAKELYGEDVEYKSVVGKELQIAVNNKFYAYTVAGVYEKDESPMEAMLGGGKSSDAYIPFRTAMKMTHTTSLTGFDVIVDANVDSSEFSQKTEQFFERYYKNNATWKPYAFSMAAVADSISGIMNTITVAISVIAGIALLVGGIGVMNIMLVSITERTREIGTRKALGAPNSSIRLQFIVEAIVICVIGGIIGIILGIIMGEVGASLMKAECVISAKSIFLSLGFSMGIGVFFGYYPANKAAKMDPIEALRYE